MKHLLTCLFIGGFSFLLSAQSNITFTSSCNETTICNETSDCADISPNLSAIATTDCASSSNLVFSYQIDINNDNSVDISGSSSNINDLLPLGEHRVLFIATDQCNTSATCEFLISIVDCLKPTPVCIFGIATVNMSNAGTVDIPASLFNMDSYDNCTPDNNLIFSFSEDINDITKTIACADVPADGLVPLSIYATDEAGNFDFCNTFINIEDPNDACAPPPTTGVVSAANGCGDNVENVSWNVNGIISPNPPATVNVGDIITPIANSNIALNGVSTYDLVLIDRHILNITPFAEPWQWIAADVNNSQTITSLDHVKIKAIILHQTTQFPGGQSWVFSPPSIVVDNNFTDFEFTAIHLGDVNCTAMLLTSNDVDTRTGDASLNFTTENQYIKAGNTYSIPIVAQNFENIIGGQFTLDFDTDALAFQSIEANNFEDLTHESFGTSLVEDGIVLCSWNSDIGKNMDAHTPFYNITFTAKKDGHLSDFLAINSKQITAEAYEENGNNFEFLNIELNFEEVFKNSDVQISPNPFSKKTTLNFSLENENEVILKIFAVNGRTVFSIQTNGNQGANQIEILRKDLQSSGIYFYQLNTSNHLFSGKIIVE